MPIVRGVRVSSPDRVPWPELGLAKLEDVERPDRLSPVLARLSGATAPAPSR